jgi:hypothetical protein
MSELLDLVLHAHGGLDRWRKFNKVSATIVAGGGLLPMKGLDVDPKPLEGTVTVHEESTLIRPFGQPDWRMIFAPERVVIETTAGVVVQERSNPRAAFAGHTMKYALGPTSSWILQWLCAMDVPYDSIPDGNAGLRGERNCAVARGRRALARLARSIPGRNRQPQQRTGLLLRRRFPASPA